MVCIEQLSQSWAGSIRFLPSFFAQSHFFFHFQHVHNASEKWILAVVCVDMAVTVFLSPAAVGFVVGIDRIPDPGIDGPRDWLSTSERSAVPRNIPYWKRLASCAVLVIQVFVRY